MVDNPTPTLLEVMYGGKTTETIKPPASLPSEEEALNKARHSEYPDWRVTPENAEVVLKRYGPELARVEYAIQRQTGQIEGQAKLFRSDEALIKLWRDQRRLKARVTVARELLEQQQAEGREKYAQAEAAADIHAEEASIRAAFEGEERREREERYQVFRTARLKEIYGEPEPAQANGKGKPRR